jgi:hypothetical protein
LVIEAGREDAIRAASFARSRFVSGHPHPFRFYKKSRPAAGRREERGKPIDTFLEAAQRRSRSKTHITDGANTLAQSAKHPSIHVRIFNNFLGFLYWTRKIRQKEDRVHRKRAFLKKICPAAGR